MRLIIKENETIKSGFFNYEINDVTAHVECFLTFSPKSFSVTPKNERCNISVVSEFTIVPDHASDVLSFNYRKVGEVKRFGKYLLTVKSKDCSSVKCSISSDDGDAKGEVLFDTHKICLMIWRIDVEYTNRIGEKMKMRCVHG